MWREIPDSEGLLATCGDEAVAELAARQGGVVSVAQLRAAGLGTGAIEHRVRRGRLHPLHRGVYAVGHTRLARNGADWAALLACGGPGAAVLSHRAAAALWDLLPSPAGPVDVTTFAASRSREGIRVHRSATLDRRRDVTEQDGLPVTTVARTLLDLAPHVSPHRLQRLCDRAEILRLDAGASPPRRARGAAKLRAAQATLATREPHLTRSALEDRFLSLVAKKNLPRPRTNAHVAGLEVDFLWPRQSLVAETDGAAAHLTPKAFHEDRRRDAHLLLAGYRVIRFTWRDITEHPARVADTLAALLAT